MTKDEARGILRQVQENSKRLSECKGPHDFVPLATYPGSTLVRQYECTLCKGTIHFSDFHWYKRGLEHGRRNS